MKLFVLCVVSSKCGNSLLMPWNSCFVTLCDSLSRNTSKRCQTIENQLLCDKKRGVHLKSLESSMYHFDKATQE